MPRRRNGESRHSPRRFRAAERQQEALGLRIAGASYAQIAEQLGYRGPQGAKAAIDAVLLKTAREPAATSRVTTQLG